MEDCISDIVAISSLKLSAAAAVGSVVAVVLALVAFGGGGCWLECCISDFVAHVVAVSSLVSELRRTKPPKLHLVGGCWWVWVI